MSLAYLIGLAGEFAYSVRLTAELENLVSEFNRLHEKGHFKTENGDKIDFCQFKAMLRK